jgi:hypothetical protein
MNQLLPRTANACHVDGEGVHERKRLSRTHF